MNVPNFPRKQAGFTLIELIVVIVILGILAATALPRMFDMSAQARIAKMQAALGAIKAASNTGHASWMVSGGVMACTGCGTTAVPNQTASPVTAETVTIPTRGGYPDVGGDGFTNGTGVLLDSGIVKAANLTDYIVTSVVGEEATTIAVTPDVSHPDCKITYKEAVQTNSTALGVQPTAVPPVIIDTALTTTNCD